MSGWGLSGRGGAILSRVYLGAGFLFVFAPIMASVVFSFNSDRFPSIPLGSFTFHWYQKAFSDPDVWDAFATSLKVALSVALLATAIGFCTAYTDFRFGFRFKPAYLALALFPFPNVCENVDFGLRMRGVGAAERRRRAGNWG